MTQKICLDSDRLDEVFLACLFSADEDIGNPVKVTINRGDNALFHPDRLESHKVEIEMMLNELPKQFKKSGFDGSFFQNAGDNPHDILQQRTRRLGLLGMGIVELLFQKEAEEDGMV